MTREVSESEWKIFHELREISLQRYCERVCDDIDRIRQDDSKTHHQRYLDIFVLVQDRDEEMAPAFNNPRRSRMFRHLALINALGLLDPGEFERFTTSTRDYVQSLPHEVLG